jgi:hypothetical protein
VGGTVQDTYDYTHCRITATYEYDILSGDEPEVSGDCSTEALNIAQGRFWSYCTKPTLMTPVPVEDATPVMIPGLSITFRIVRWAVPLATIYAYTGKVNGASWNGAASETLLYEGATWNSDYNAQTGQFRWIIQHRFRWRAFSWNEIWRPPHLKTEADGTSIPDADGFPVYDIPAGWDRPIDGEGNSIYLPANFNDLML